jgi:hypothetical protein
MNPSKYRWAVLSAATCLLSVSIHAATVSGRLEAGDPRNDDKYRDAYVFQGEAGQEIAIDLRSTDFDTIVELQAPSGARQENDDFEGETRHSRIETTLSETGTFIVYVTSFDDATGAYTLQLPDEQNTAGAPPEDTRRFGFVGRLESGDSRNGSKYRDTFTFQGTAGQAVTIDLRSPDFDTVVEMQAPSGSSQENDDFGGESRHSRIEATLSESGTYTVYVTSYLNDATGAYTLQIPGAPEIPLVANTTLEGRLESGDTRNGDKYRDSYTFSGTSGAQVIVDLRSEEFDTFVTLESPSGSTQENDDFGGEARRSRIETVLAESGTYTVHVSSYGSNVIGPYSLEVPAGAIAVAPIVRQAVASITLQGSLSNGDATDSGKFRDAYTFQGTSGQQVVVDVESADFDTVVTLRSPSGQQQENDDWQGQIRHSRIESGLTETGTYTVYVSSYGASATGSYTLQIPQGGTAVAAGNADGTQIRRETGTLAEGDQTLGSGEYYDRFTFSGRAGDRVVLDLRSSEFDPYIGLSTPGGETTENDDHEGSGSWSRLAATLAESGTFTVTVTSYRASEVGAYELVITQRGDAAAGARHRSENGSLAAGDEQSGDGKYTDRYNVTAAPGDRIVLDLRSSDFDTYLVLRGPGGENATNDDYEGSTRRSRIEHIAAGGGEYTVLVTSYSPNTTGDYGLSIEIDQPSTVTQPATDLVSISPGQTRQGRLEAGDLTRDENIPADVYAFDGAPGQTIAIDLRSSSFDPYLRVVTPDGQSIDNDDFEGSLQHSRIELPVSASGRYRIYASAYSSSASGAYDLALQQLTGSALGGPVAIAPGGEGTLYGIFVGISDYGDRASDLSYTDRDAVEVESAMREALGMPAANSTLLLNENATRTNFEAALRRVAANATERDTLVIFYSGHGGRVDRPGGPDRSDPDGKDETLVFRDDDLLDDELDRLLNNVRAGRQLLVFDSCFSGGFAKDVISAPGRMGLFSSEEDVTSAVAAKFRAGGYLSYFFSDSIREPVVDDDDDGALSALEISHYIAERYRSQVKGPADDWVSTGQDLSYQKLVVDRGSIRPYDIVFRRR